jgi:transcriptional regulator with XRE-family HTH domain
MEQDEEATTQKEFGKRLRQLRRRRGLSQEDLAFRSQLDRSYIGQVERGERNISLINIHKLARGLGASPHELLMPPEDEQVT